VVIGWGRTGEGGKDRARGWLRRGKKNSWEGEQ
jgi:hypothetical protein